MTPGKIEEDFGTYVECEGANLRPRINHPVTVVGRVPLTHAGAKGGDAASPVLRV